MIENEVDIKSVADKNAFLSDEEYYES